GALIRSRCGRACGGANKSPTAAADRPQARPTPPVASRRSAGPWRCSRVPGAARGSFNPLKFVIEYLFGLDASNQFPTRNLGKPCRHKRTRNRTKFVVPAETQAGLAVAKD